MEREDNTKRKKPLALQHVVAMIVGCVAKVRIVYRRREEDMAALAEEVEGAMAEDCQMIPLAAPMRIEADGEN